MLIDAIKRVINSTLGYIIDDIDSNNLDVSLLSGNIILNNSALKSSFIKSLNLPIVMQKGHIGKNLIKIN